MIFCRFFSCISLSSGPKANNFLLCHLSVSVAIKIQFLGVAIHRGHGGRCGGLCCVPQGGSCPLLERLQLQRLFLPAALQMPSDLACRMSANSLGLSILNGPLVCPVCHFLYWRAAAFPCTAPSMVTSQDLTQSMRIYSSVSTSCSTLFEFDEAELAAHYQDSRGKDLPQKALVVQS